MMIRLSILGLILSTLPLLAVNFQDFDGYQNMFCQEEVEQKIKNYLQKDPQVSAFYRLTPEALYIGDLAQKKEDYILQLASCTQPKRSQCFPSLKGAKIAIDPGHFGGAFARLEERFIKLSAAQAKTEHEISFDEGTLTYLTAIHLKALLEAEEANVFVTRAGINQGAFQESFFEWLAKEPLLWSSKEPLTSLFRTYYNRLDLIARAEKINEFKPDLTLILHYNAVGAGALGEENYNLAFIPGAFRAGELDKIEDRYEFLRLIVTDDLEKSLALSQNVVEHFVRELHVPLVSQSTKISYLEKACLWQQTGVYSRNLALTRLVHGPLCYGETLIQNCREECLRLAKTDTEIAGIRCSSRVKEVAQAYFEAVKAYFNDQQ